MRKHDVFISYKAEEFEEASWVKSVLNENGISCWMAPASIPGGSSYADEIDSAIQNCGVFVLILSSLAQSSKWIKKELDIALNYNKVILPFAIEDCKLQSAFNLYLTDIQRYYAYESRVMAIQTMIARIRTVLDTENSDAARVIRVNTPHLVEKNVSDTSPKRGGHYLRSVLILVPYALGLFLPLILFLLKSEFSVLLRLLYLAWIVLGACWILHQIETNPRIASLCFGTIKETDLRKTPDEVYSGIVSVFGNKAFISNDCPPGFLSYYTLRLIEFGSWDGKCVNYLKIHFKPGLERYDPSVLYLHTLSRGSQAIKMLLNQGFTLSVPPACMPRNTTYLVKGNLHVCLYHKKNALCGAVIYQCGAEELTNHYQGEWHE